MTNRKQRTKINDEVSTLIDCNCGVPQGNVLVLLLFVLYVNDITHVLKYSRVNLFADDTLMWIACDSIQEALYKMNSDLENVYIWLCFHKLSLNVEKPKL
jgi:hypothetical protein